MARELGVNWAEKCRKALRDARCEMRDDERNEKKKERRSHDKKLID